MSVFFIFLSITRIFKIFVIILILSSVCLISNYTFPICATAQDLRSGHNSFSEEQARDIVKQSGFDNPRALRLDNNGVWRAIVLKNGKCLLVSIDYRGTVASTPTNGPCDAKARWG